MADLSSGFHATIVMVAKADDDDDAPGALPPSADEGEWAEVVEGRTEVVAVGMARILFSLLPLMICIVLYLCRKFKYQNTQ